MRRSRPGRLSLVPAASLLCFLLLAACEDPSGVGLSVLDPDENDPRAQVLTASETALAPLADPTGEFATSQTFLDFRALAGSVADPLFGTATAAAYLDVLPSGSISDEFRERAIDEVNLRLVRSYVYGDTAATTTLDLRQIEEEWSATSALADTTFPVMDEVITSFEVAASDSLVVVPLPEDWIEANDTTLRDESFSTLFHGFRLSAPDASASAVYGFSGRSELELISGSGEDRDTVIYVASELFSNVVHEAPPSFPAELLPVQDGISTGLGVEFVFDALGTPALNTASLRLNADTVATRSDLPTGFVRPLARELALYGTFDDGDPILLATADLDEETATYSFRSSVLTDILQELILDGDPVDGFAVGVPPSRASLDAIALVGAPAESGPRAVLILVPSQD